MRGGVSLEPLAETHLEGAAALWGDPEAIRFTRVERPLTPAEAAARLRTLLESQRGLPEALVFAVLEGGDFCGLAGCLPADLERRAFGLFYQLLPSCWGRGVGRSAAELALASLRRRFPDAAVLADTAAENRASVRILERLGFRRTAVHPGALVRDGRALEVWDYELSAGGGEEACP